MVEQLLRLLVAGLALLTLAACAAPGGPAGGTASTEAPTAPKSPPRQVRIALATISESVAPVIVARDAGFTTREGLDVEIITARSGSEAMAALISQDVQLGAIGGNAVISAGAAGAALVMVAQLQPRLTYQVLSAPELREV